MTLKYAHPFKLFMYLILAIIKSFEMVFVAYTFKLFIDYANKPKGSLLNIVLVAFGVLVLLGIAGVLYQLLYANIVTEINLNIKAKAAKYLLVNRNSNSEIDVSFMTNDLKQLETNRIEAQLDIIMNAIQFISAFVSALLGSWILSLVFLFAAFAPALLQNIFGPMIEKSSDVWEKENRKYTNTVDDSLTIAPMSQLYDVEPSLMHRLYKAAKNMELALRKTNSVKQIANELTMTLAFICSMLLPFAIGVYLVVNGQITLGTIMMIAQLANNFINPIVGIFGDINNVKSTNPIWNKFLAIPELTKESIESATNKFTNLKIQNAAIKINDKQIFSNVNLDVKSGEKILLDAPSGWGKSTLLNVITGNYKLTTGDYLFNGKEENGNWSQLHQYFSFINQKPIILDDTLGFNITLGRKVSAEILDNAITKAGLKELVADKGLDYQVDKNGKNLSGGQNQRVEIARAIIADRPILIADEATSALDQELSEKIHQTILEDFPGTVIEVAHKVSEKEKAKFTQVVELVKA